MLLNLIHFPYTDLAMGPFRWSLSPNGGLAGRIMDRRKKRVNNDNKNKIRMSRGK